MFTRFVTLTIALALTVVVSADEPQYGTAKTLHIFTGAPDGQFPFGGLTTGKHGELYGTTQYGGSSPACKNPSGCSAVYELDPPTVPGGTWSEKVIYSFPGPYQWYPLSSPTVGPNGELYGTAYYGGSAGVGSVYELIPPSIPGGSWTETTLYHFSGAFGDPQNPEGGLVIGPNGVLYGTVEYAGTSANCPELGYNSQYGCGAVFSLAPPSTPSGSWTYQTLYTFSGNDGAAPLTTLAIGSTGELYGTTYYGGGSVTCTYLGTPIGCGTVFELDPPASPGGTWTQTILYRFNGGGDGGYPNSIVYRGGVLYGTVTFGGDLKTCGGYGCGGVFRLNPPASTAEAWKETVIYSFSGGRDGLYPAAGIVIGKRGKIYGTTRDGGNARSCPENPGCGVVFELTGAEDEHEGWHERVLHRFNAEEGAEPTAPLVIDHEGNLYGTTFIGGTSTVCSPNNETFPFGCGSVFEVKASDESVWIQAEAHSSAMETVSLIPERPQQAQQVHIPPNVFSKRPSLLDCRKMQAGVRPSIATTAAIPPLGNYAFVAINIPNSANGVYPGGINNDGVVVGTYYDTNYVGHGFVWKAGTAQGLDYPGAGPSGTNLLGINNRGVAIGYYYDSNGYAHAVTYSLNLSTWSTLPEIPNFPSNAPGGINDEGVAVGFAQSFVGPQETLSWIWHPDSQSYSFFSVPGAQETSTYPLGINDEKQIVGGFYSWNNIFSEHSFLRDRCADEDYEEVDMSCSYQQINVPGTFLSTYANNINNRGGIVGFFFDANSNEYGFVRTPAGEFKSVSAPGGVNGTTVNGINDHGALCGSLNNSAFQTVGFVAYPQ